MPYAENDGQKIYYEVEGEGPSVLFIPGFGADHKIWFRQRSFLAHGFRTIAMDNRGVGKSSPVASSYSFEDMAADAAAVIRSADAGPARVVGASMGATVAAALASLYPDLADRIVLISATPNVSANTLVALSIARMALEKGGPEAFARIMVAQIFSPAFVRDHARDIEAIEKSYAPPEDLVPEIYRQYEATVSFAGKSLPLPKCPALLIGGAKDMIVPAEEMVGAASLLPNASLKIIENVGHGLLVEKWKEINKALQSFLASSDSH